MNVSLRYTPALAVFAALTFTGRTSPSGDLPAPAAQARPSPHSVTLASSHSAALTHPQQMVASVSPQAGLLGAAPTRETGVGSQSDSAVRSAGGEVAGRCGSGMVGFVNVTRRGDTVRLFLNVLNAPPGEHAVRLHQTADCTASDAASAGEVWRPLARAGEPQLGNLGNLHVDASGHGHLAFSAADWTLGGGSETDLIGRALVIHERSGELLGGAPSEVRIGCAAIASLARPTARFDR